MMGRARGRADGSSSRTAGRHVLHAVASPSRDEALRTRSPGAGVLLSGGLLARHQMATGSSPLTARRYLTKVRQMDAEMVERVRSFNRTVTERVGALDDHYLGFTRGLG